MMRRLGVFLSISFLVFGNVLICHQRVRASFHLWDITEVYSNADGSVQFVEMFTDDPGEQFLNGHDLTSDANTFIFPFNSPTPTENHHLLIATAGFADLPGGVTPDYTLPANFFDPADDTIRFDIYDTANFTNAPTDGVMSLHYPFGSNTATVAVNSPTNHAGDVGSLTAPGLDGDYNNDGVVNAADYAAWLAGLGGTELANDPTPGTVDQSDYAYWKQHFGDALGSGAASTVTNVPEPVSILLLALAGLLADWRIDRGVARRSR